MLFPYNNSKKLRRTHTKIEYNKIVFKILACMSKHRYKFNINMDLKEIGVNMVHLRELV